MTLPCDYSELADHGTTPPCWGAVTVVSIFEMSNGDRVEVKACCGHQGIAEHGFYLEEGAPVSPESVGVSEKLVSLWEGVPSELSLLDDLNDYI